MKLTQADAVCPLYKFGIGSMCFYRNSYILTHITIQIVEESGTLVVWQLLMLAINHISTQSYTQSHPTP